MVQILGGVFLFFEQCFQRNSRTEAEWRIRIEQLTLARSVDQVYKALGKLDAIALLYYSSIGLS